MYEIFKLPLEDLAVQDALYFILLDSIMDYGGWQVVLYLHTTPYIPSAQLEGFSISNLLDSFPNLVHAIVFGSPISNPPSLCKTFLPPNLTSVTLHTTIIDQELWSEVSAQCMSGPFSIEQATVIFCGPFQSSPVGLVEKVPGDGIWRMIRHLSKCDGDGQSTNS